MPREIVHWHVLDLSLERANEAPMVINYAGCVVSLAYLGAMTPDALYYHRYGRDFISNTLGERIHGRDGEDTFSLVNAMIREMRSLNASEREPLWGFLAGYLSHCAVDVVFHPWIFYVTGDYYHQDPKQRRSARTRHRLFEVYLDSWFRVRHPCRQSERVSDHLAGVGTNLQKISSLIGCASQVLADANMSTQVIDGEKRWRGGFHDIALQQDRFLSERWGFAVFLLNQLTGHALDPIDALCSFRRRDAKTHFDQAFEFRNPISGEVKNSSVNILIDQAVSLTLAYWKELESCITNPSEAFALGSIGPSLNYGLIGAHHSSALFYSPDPVPLPGFGT